MYIFCACSPALPITYCACPSTQGVYIGWCTLSVLLYHCCHHPFCLLSSLRPFSQSCTIIIIAVTTATGPGGRGGIWGNPKATNTPAPEYFGNITGGFGGGSGMTQIQQMVSERGSGGMGRCGEGRQAKLQLYCKEKARVYCASSGSNDVVGVGTSLLCLPHLHCPSPFRF